MKKEYTFPHTPIWTVTMGSIFVLLLTFGCQPKVVETAKIQLDPAESSRLAQEIRQQVAAKVADGLELTLWASDTLAPDPIAMSMDLQGRVYITRTNRQKNSEFDIRGHRDWMTASISLQSVEDRRAFLRETFAPEKSEENSWFPDLNKDGSHDWKDLMVEKEQVFRLEDISGDGVADVSQLVLEDFHTEITDVAGAIMVRENDAFLGVGPDMWRLKDNNGDGWMDEKTSISHGYIVHIGFGAHGMSGLTMGPDGKVYWSVGDVGLNVTDQTGKVWKYPNQGAILRANPDGSDFEVFAAGLRNTHEFVFDPYGNIISVDNDGDHPGESERLVHIVNGSDSGWRTNWQFGKYTDPDNNLYKVWMDEGLYKPRFEGQAAYIIPPIRNYHNGPTGMRYNPGTALGEYWKEKFFVVEFPGTPARANIYAFQLDPKGASFEFAREDTVLNGILATGIEFGPEGALYVADWLEGWGTKNKGRVWKLDVNQKEISPIRKETQQILTSNFAEKSGEELLPLLSHADMRVRQKAQFELAIRGEKGKAVLLQSLEQTDHLFGRIHGVWGIAQLARRESHHAEGLLPYLTDADAEIRAQAAKWLGDIRYVAAGDDLIPLLKDDAPRVRFFAAEALGRIAHKPAVQDIIDMLEANNDEDVYLRHAGALALARIGEAEPIISLAQHPNRSLRIAAVVALRRMHHPGVAKFLQDKEEYIVTEAARAINDDGSIEEALPALAALLETTSFENEALVRRIINANLRVGGEAELDRLINYSSCFNCPVPLWAEAINTLSVWAKPSVLDRVDGRLRGPIERPVDMVKNKFSPVIPKLLSQDTPKIQVATLKAIGKLQIKELGTLVLNKLENSNQAEVRIAALETLTDLNDPKIELALEKGLADSDPTVRSTALKILPRLDLPEESTVDLLASVLKQPGVEESQTALSVLGKLGSPAVPILHEQLDRLVAGTLSPELELDLGQAITAQNNPELTEKLEAFRASRSPEDPIAEYRESLMGGNAQAGREVIRRNEAAQCSRCHAFGRYGGGNVGPDLIQIGAQLSREEILASLVAPSARIAPGYGMVTLTLKDDQKISGIVKEETAQHLVLQTTDAEPVKVPVSKIERRQNAPSSMPAMGTILTRTELRDVVEFLSTLKGEES